MEANHRLARLIDGQGFVAALDQSGGSTPKALRLYGITEDCYSTEDEMMCLMHAMRVRIVSSPAFSSKNLIGAILFERTMQSEINGKPSADYIWEDCGVLPFLKIDLGLEEERDGISLMKPIADIDGRTKRARECNMFGTKMRSVIHQPGHARVAEIVSQQFEFANRILDAGLVPIVEPEISIICPEKDDCEAMLRDALLEQLDNQSEGREVAFKLTLPETANRYAEVSAHPRALRLMALSGGYDQAEACSRLAANSNMVASFSRALVEGLSHSMSDAEFDAALERSVRRIHQASVT